MAIEPFKILRGATIDGATSINGDTTITGDASISAKIINTDFFPLTPFVTETITVAPGAGVRIDSDPKKFFINVSLNPIDVSSDSITPFLDPTKWREWFSARPSNGVSLYDFEFQENSWIKPTPDSGDTLIVHIPHGLNTQNINVKFYEQGTNATTNASVFVPWKYTSGEENNSITACIPRSSDDDRTNAFEGVVRITSDIATSANEKRFNYDFNSDVAPTVDASWQSLDSERSMVKFTYDFSSNSLETEIYDNSGNEVLVCIEQDTLIPDTVSLIVYKGDEFRGYAVVRG